MRRIPGRGTKHAVQVDVDLVEQELQAAAAVEAELRSALAALQRDYDTATVLNASLQEQLRDRDQRVRLQFDRGAARSPVGAAGTAGASAHGRLHVKAHVNQSVSVR